MPLDRSVLHPIFQTISNILHLIGILSDQLFLVSHKHNLCFRFINRHFNMHAEEALISLLHLLKHPQKAIYHWLTTKASL